MRYVVCIPDGAADEPLSELGGRTPLEAAAMPNLARLAAAGEVGRAAVIPAGMPPGSDVGNMAILGYDPARYHTGRAPIEAAAMGIDLQPGQVAYRCNLVTLDDAQSPAIMVDFSAHHIATELSTPIIEAVDAELGGGRDGVRFHPGVMYRHVMVAPAELAKADCVPPHDLTGKPVVLPDGPAAAELRRIMEASKEIVRAKAAELGADATQVWLWGQGTRPMLPSFESRWGLTGRLVTAVDLIRGLGVLSGIDPVEVPGATGYYDTDYEAKRDACLASLADRALFVIHVEASDEAGHNGEADRKVEALENWDRRIIGPLVEALDDLGPWRLFLMPDHATPCALRTHTSEPVPYLIYDPADPGPGGVYTESGVAACPTVPAHELMARFLQRTPAIP
ncbi:MAG: 2,3-bisphosphoglycerate-independent phosphoglycerate mutase [Actinomycetota bacterium]|nr:2,3-bisphosphoglycerate-independent phosphoglycerate mutase [Actinomycetota bacterium]